MRLAYGGYCIFFIRLPELFKSYLGEKFFDILRNPLRKFQLQFYFNCNSERSVLYNLFIVLRLILRSVDHKISILLVIQKLDKKYRS